MSFPGDIQEDPYRTTMKGIIDDACVELSLPPLSSVVGNTIDPTAALMRRLLTAEGRALAKRHAWQVLTRERGFYTVAFGGQPGSLSTDFDRMVPETMWDRTQKRFVYGPIDAQEWAAIQASGNTFINPCFRIRWSMVWLHPTPPADQLYTFEYVSKSWCIIGSGGQFYTSMQHDDDLPLLDAEALTLGLIYRFRADKGFEFGDDLKEYERRVADLIMTDGSRPRLTGSTISTDRVPRAPQAPETIVWP